MVTAYSSPGLTAQHPTRRTGNPRLCQGPPTGSAVPMQTTRWLRRPIGSAGERPVTSHQDVPADQAAAIFDGVADSIAAIGHALMALPNASNRAGSLWRRAYTNPTLADGAWARRPLLEAYGLAGQMAYHCSDHLLGAAACLRAPHVLYSVFTLSRAALESAAGAWYLLDPACDERERVRRWLNEQLHSLTEEHSLAAGLGDPPAVAVAQERMDRARAILTAATRHGFTAHNATLRPGKSGRILTPYLGSPRPSAMAMIDLLPSSRTTAYTAYRWMSAKVHPNHAGLASLLVVDQAQDHRLPGMSTVPIGIDLYRLVVLTAPALAGADTIAQQLIQAKGLNPGPWNQIAQPVLRQWRDWLRAAEERATADGAASSSQGASRDGPAGGAAPDTTS